MATVLVAGGAVVFAAVLLKVALSDLVEFDTVQVLDVITDQTTRRHAVICRQVRAESSSTFTAVWIVEGAAPERGSRERPAGDPAAVWIAGTSARIGWQAGRLQLVGDQVKVLVDQRSVGACAAANSPPEASRREWDLCLDPARVTFVRIPR